jgi:hypothetical protein
LKLKADEVLAKDRELNGSVFEPTVIGKIILLLYKALRQADARAGALLIHER